MSEEDVEYIRAGYAAFNKRDREGIKAVLDPEVVWYPALGALLSRTRYEGPEEICNLVLEEIPAVLEGFRAELVDVEDFGGGTALATVRFTGTATSTGLKIEQTFFQLFRARNHKGIEMRSFPSRSEALEAAGLSE